MLRFISAIILVLLVTGCAEPRPAVLYGPTGELTADDYEAVLKTWTQAHKHYDGLFDNIIFFSATYHSPEFRRAFAVAFPDIYGHGGDVTRRELVDLTDGIEQFHTFFFVAYTPEDDWNDFNKDDSIWRMTLTGSTGVSAGPHEIVLVNIDENLRSVYPYIGRFDEAYLVRFPLTDSLEQLLVPPEATSFTLQIISALGKTEATWPLRKGTPE